MTDRAALLDYAEEILDGAVDLGPRSARVAALLARSAFEDWLDEQNPWVVPSPRRPTTASKLVALCTRDDPAVGYRAQRAWASLSRACHHHAYELQPSAAEVRDLVALVRDLEADVAH
jgi:hypothetical protein